jgi:hypothetical protein
MGSVKMEAELWRRVRRADQACRSARCANGLSD